MFGHFPVRIGRNPLNDLKLLPGFVSQFHAVLELRGTSLMLRDLGSKNGTVLPSGERAPAHDMIALEEHQGQFAISALSFRATVEDVGEVAPARAPQRGLLLGGLGAEKAQFAETMLADPAHVSFVVAEPVVVPAQPAELGEGTPALRSQIKAYKASRGTIGRVLQTLASEITSVPPDQRQALLSWAREAFPNIAEEPEFKRLIEHHGAVFDERDAGAAGRRLEYVALQAVRELATLYRPRSAPIGSEQELVEFLTRVRDTLDVFFKTFVPLRDGYRQFKSDMDIREATPYFDSPAGRAMAAVSRAKTPMALAELLLGTSDDQLAAHRAVEGTFADLMIHQLALLSGVMKGVYSLMGELAPSGIEAMLEERRRKGEAGFTLGPYRFRELWKLFAARYGDLTESDKQLYAAVFGHDFVRAYAQLSGEASAHVATGENPVATDG